MNIDRPNIDRAMVTLFFEIKRNMPFDAREDIVASNRQAVNFRLSSFEQ
ncbi:MAG: hypothetical protein ACJA2E_000235 [Arenicella sp.]|jgi:hypothetical protein